MFTSEKKPGGMPLPWWLLMPVCVGPNKEILTQYDMKHTEMTGLIKFAINHREGKVSLPKPEPWVATTPRYSGQVGVPAAGFYREVMNTDAAEYWGSGVGNLGGVEAEEIAHLDKPYSLRLTIPPLAVMYFKREGDSAIT